MQPSSIKAMLGSRAATHPDSIAIRSLASTTASYGDVVDQLVYTEEFLNTIAVQRVAIVLAQGPEMALVCLSLMGCACAVPLNPNYTAAELSSYLSELEAEAVIFDVSTEKLVFDATSDFRLRKISLTPTEQANGRFELKDLSLAEEFCNESIQAPTPFSLVLLTSGSTSKPKVVGLTQSNLLHSAANLANSLELSKSDCCLNMLPLFHVGAIVDLLLGPFYVGGSSLVCDSIRPENFYESVGRYPVTWFQAVPAILQVILDVSSEYDSLSDKHQLRFIRSVSSPIAPGLLKKLEDRFSIPVIEIYGMTETTGLITSNPLPPKERRVGSVGVSFGPQLKIIDDLGNPLGHEAKGEIVVKGETVISGYQNDIKANEIAFIDGWLRTGDEGMLSKDGYLTITGRIKEQINRGGEKISPREIDEVAMLFEGVQEAASFPVSHPSLGEDVAIALVVSAEKNFDKVFFQKHCSLFLARFKIPQRIVLVDSLPKGGSGKLQRFRLPSLLNNELGPVVHTIRKPRSGFESELMSKVNQFLKLDIDNLDEDFFELGGDSLLAVQLIDGIEKFAGHSIGVATLYDYPNLAEFCDFVEAQDKEGLDLAPSKTETRDSALTTEMLSALLKKCIAFKGSGRRPDSFLRGINQLSTKPPLFWCTNNAGEFNQFASALSLKQAVYGMRTLWGIPGRTEKTTRALAQMYLEEIIEIQPEGPYFLGGFCEGGKIAKELSQLLVESGREVGLLILQEACLMTPYSGRLALFYCPDSPFSAYTKFQSPEYGWSKLYTGHVTVHKTPWSHYTTQTRENAQKLSHLVEAELKAAHSKTRLDTFEPIFDLQKLEESDYSASVTIKGKPWLPIPGKSYNLAVTVKNKSETAWLPTTQSGIMLGVRWVTVFGHYHGAVDSFSSIDEVIPAGKAVVFHFQVKVPAEKKPWQLDVDLVDQGVRWFFSADEKNFRSRPLLLNRESIWHRMAQKIYQRFYR